MVFVHEGVVFGGTHMGQGEGADGRAAQQQLPALTVGWVPVMHVGCRGSCEVLTRRPP